MNNDLSIFLKNIFIIVNIIENNSPYFPNKKQELSSTPCNFFYIIFKQKQIINSKRNTWKRSK